MNKRIFIGFIYLVLFIITFLMFVFPFSRFVFFADSQTNQLPNIFGRIFFIFAFTLLGVSFRAFKYAEIGSVPPWRAYFVEYLIISIVVVPIIFSGVTLIINDSYGYLFYVLGAPLAIITGFGGYRTLEALTGKTS